MENVIEHIEDLIVSSLIGDIDEAGREELQQWVALSPENEKHLLDEQEIWFSYAESPSLSKYNVENAYQLFLQRISEDRHHRHINRWWLYAAAVLALFIASYASYKSGEHGVKSSFADIEIEAPQGSRTKLNLPDGTLVWLNAGSRIAYSQGFGVDGRSVKMSGEGYFEVKKNPELPFTVKTENLLVRDIGTKFNVRDYHEDAEAVVLLSEGKVVLNDAHSADLYYLTNNQRAVLNKSTGKIEVDSYVASNSTKWINGYIQLNGESIVDIAKYFERIYNVRITVSDKRKLKYHFYGNFKRNEQSLTEVLDAMSKTGKFKYSIKGHKVTIY